jgi:hypothetical protein
VPAKYGARDKLAPQNASSVAMTKGRNLLSSRGNSHSLPSLLQRTDRENPGQNSHDQSFLALTGGVAVKDRVRSIPRTEERGIMVKQLEVLLEFIHSRSKHWRDDPIVPGWYDFRSGGTVSYKAVNLHHVSDWIIKPMTLPVKCSYVEAIAFSVESQVPSWFVSHWWGEPIRESVASLKAHAKVKHPDSCGVTSAYWMCAFANNQHKLSSELVDDPRGSSFFKALGLCEGVVLLLDRHSPAAAFQRLWCNFEINAATDKHRHLLLDIVAADECGELHVLTDGMTVAESRKEAASQECPWLTSGRTTQATREEQFPILMMHQGLNVKIIDAKVSSAQDRVHILNNILGHLLSAAPDLSNTIYDEVDNRLRSRFAMLSLRSALQHYPSVDISDNGNLPIARVLREDPTMETLQLDLSSCWRMTDSCLRALASCIPTSPTQLKRVNLKFNLCYQLTCIAPLLQALGKVQDLQEISLDFTDCTGLKASNDFAAFGTLLNANSRTSQVNMNFTACNTKLAPCLEAMTRSLKSSSRSLKVISTDGENLALDDNEEVKPRAKPKPKAKKKKFVSETAKWWSSSKSVRKPDDNTAPKQDDEAAM